MTTIAILNARVSIVTEYGERIVRIEDLDDALWAVLPSLLGDGLVGWVEEGLMIL